MHCGRNNHKLKDCTILDAGRKKWTDVRPSPGLVNADQKGRKKTIQEQDEKVRKATEEATKGSQADEPELKSWQKDLRTTSETVD